MKNKILSFFFWLLLLPLILVLDLFVFLAFPIGLLYDMLSDGF